MGTRRRTTQHKDIARSFGGRSGFVSEELDRGGCPPEQMSRAERTLAWWQWSDSANHYEDYADDNHFRLNRLVPSVDLLVAIAIVVLFVGGYGAFIACLALTR
ncbi:hypothetical protein GCM10011376_21090 [Nocardioides flavus (ex Wang et al. 2016)]|uniref:Uncharacterized protein n=1 Tax=Nocardioides flavus (ex Wang et al. 2016) TaxID=2058780 RepID=A0ABQ3HLF9_9ACTN|nr:hypothetical protein [Nocardioides flavus (ex Wang et al. 2016)]GHE17499.1 hypothetical protein GCM10011376_21090 [Nocardioides flavus (ex Wang et al. 2016)]